jgi:hypothetical protein
VWCQPQASRSSVIAIRARSALRFMGCFPPEDLEASL